MNQNAEQCRLCGVPASLCESHIIPKFVFRWMKKTGPTGGLRTAHVPNRRVEDGLRLPFLCGECESRFERVETWFAAMFFHPVGGGDYSPVDYDERLRRFLLSVLWRVLRYTLENNGVPDSIAERAAAAELLWQQFLLGSTSLGLGEYGRVQLFVADEIAPGQVGIPKNMNRFMMRAAHMAVRDLDGQGVVLAKFGRFVTVGELMPMADSGSHCTLIAESGVFDPTSQSLDARLGQYLVDFAMDSYAAYQRGLSRKQADKLSRIYRDNPDMLSSGDYGRAAQADLQQMVTEHALDEKRQDGDTSAGRDQTINPGDP